MSTLQPFVFTLARALARRRSPSRLATDERRAARLVFRALHRARCPRCDARGATVTTRLITCRACGRETSLTRHTVLHGNRLPMRHWALAVWHVVIDTEPLSAAAFARRYGLRHVTAWQLLHRIRAALPTIRPDKRGVGAQLLGRARPTNTAHVRVASCGPLLTCIDDDDQVPRGAPVGPRTLPLHLGRLRDWLSVVHRGVWRRYLPLYLAEYSLRQRVSRRGPGESASAW